MFNLGKDEKIVTAARAAVKAFNNLGRMTQPEQSLRVRREFNQRMIALEKALKDKGEKGAK